ncbi:MAG: CPBP family intramembrane glutamic endopeptidase [Fidelibacterota bacterium]
MINSTTATPTVPWRNITVFCALAFAFFWIPFFGATLSVRGGNDPGAWGAIFGILGPFSPLLAAVLTRVLVAREGFADAHLGILNVKWYFWLLALLLPFFWNGVQDLFQVLFGFITVDGSKATLGLYRIPINLFGGLIIFIGEEFGWRSYLVEKLRPLGRWKALLYSGIIWSLWHLPAVSIPNTSTSYGLQINIMGTLLTLFIILLFGFIFGWLYLESNSVWPGVLMHSYSNLITLSLLSEAVTINKEPSLLQKSLFAVGPALLVWLVLYFRGKFSEKNPERDIVVA